MKNKKGFIPIQLIAIIFGISLVTIGIVIALQSQQEEINNEGQIAVKRTVECDVTLKKHLFGGEYIANVACDTREGCGIFDTLGIFTERGNVRLIDSKRVLDKEPWKFTTLFHETHKATLKGCTSDTEVKIKLTDDNDNFLDQKIIKLED